jgi:NADPH-dependent glutamate synthase beta subunit-like oxidoreductase/coenzyme F420-reducing hydrogenase delta subunit
MLAMSVNSSNSNHSAAPPCQAACPVQTDARRYVSLIAQERYEEALDVIMATNPLPSVIGRICAHPCETACRRGQVDQPIAICHLKRFVTDKLGYSDGSIKFKASPKTKGKSVAVIGSGPAGLAAAHNLAAKGYGVTIFDKHPEPGGMLRYGILDYRLPQDVLKSDIANIVALGIEIKTGIEIGHDIDFQQLINDHDAVLVAVGLSIGRNIPLPGVDLKGVHSVVPVLEAINAGQPIDLGQDVIVIGGGNVAVDVARSVRRLGDKTVKMVCLEARHEMPAHDWEIEDAVMEGVEMHCSWGPDKIAGAKGRVTGLEFKECTCVFDSDGRFSPQFNEAKRHILSADTIVLAVGQASELSFLKDSGVELNERGQLRFDRQTMRTSHPTVFAAGEVVAGPGAAIQAIAGGRRAAAAIDAFFSEHEPVYQGEITPLGAVPDNVVEALGKSDRRSMPKLAPEQRLDNFAEVELGFSEEDALREAQRCLGCTAGAVVDEAKCAACLTCVRICPYDVPKIIGDKAYMDPIACQSCGFCASECPAKAIEVGLTKEQLIEMQTAIGGLEAKRAPSGPAAIGFICQFGHVWGADRTYDVALPDNVRLVPVLCPGRLEPADILRAFEQGAERVFVSSCDGKYCRYGSGNGLTDRRLDYVRSILDGIGIGADKLVSFKINHETSLADIVKEMSV